MGKILNLRTGQNLNAGNAMNVDTCVQLLVPLGAVAAMWLRMEHRITRVEDRVKERYRDKQALDARITNVEKWLPQKTSEIQK